MELLKNKNLLIFLILIFIETFLISIFRGFFGYYLSPLLFFIISLSIVFYPYYLLKKKEISFASKHSNSTSFDKQLILWALFSVLSIGTYFKISFYFEDYPIDLFSSDIIPTFQRMAKLYMNREYPYKTFDDYGYILKPSYLTLHWAPFIISEYFNFDTRWMGIISLFISIVLITNYQLKSNTQFSTKILIVFIPFIIFFLFVKYSDVLRLTIETLVIGYYMLLGIILIAKKEKIWILSIGILFCLLSRFSLIIWLPTLLIVFFLEGKKKLISLIVIIFLGILFLYVIPFLLEDFSTIANHFGKAINEWYPTSSTIDNKPTKIFNGIGFSSYFYSFLPYTIPVKAKIAQYFHIIISLTIGTLCFVNYIIIDRYSINRQLYLLISLKLCLVFFYNFIHVPYPYLNMVHVFFSLVLFISIDWKKAI